MRELQFQIKTREQSIYTSGLILAFATFVEGGRTGVSRAAPLTAAGPSRGIVRRSGGDTRAPFPRQNKGMKFNSWKTKLTLFYHITIYQLQPIDSSLSVSTPNEIECMAISSC